MPIRPTNLADPVVTFVTSMGTIEVQLLPANAPVTVNNFLTYTSVGFYDGVVFHRLFKPGGTSPAIVAQAGLLAAGGNNSYSVRTPIAAPIVLETQNGLSNALGTIAMARTQVPDSAAAQFYFNTANNAADFDYINQANPGYAVFGRTLQGLDVLGAISRANTVNANASALGLGVLTDFPTQDIVIQQARSTQFFAEKRSAYRIEATGDDVRVVKIKDGSATSVELIDRLQFKDRSLGVNEVMTGSLATTALLLVATADGQSRTGGSTADELFAAGQQRVTLNGDAGKDTLIAGTGDDSFAFSTALNSKTNLDTLIGFDPQADRLLLDTTVFQAFAGQAEVAPGDLVVASKPVARAPDQHLLYNTRTGDLAYDADGNGRLKPVVFVKLVGAPVLSAEDIVLVDPPV